MLTNQQGTTYRIPAGHLQACKWIMFLRSGHSLQNTETRHKEAVRCTENESLPSNHQWCSCCHLSWSVCVQASWAPSPWPWRLTKKPSKLSLSYSIRSGLFCFWSHANFVQLGASLALHHPLHSHQHHSHHHHHHHLYHLVPASQDHPHCHHHHHLLLHVFSLVVCCCPFYLPYLFQSPFPSPFPSPSLFRFLPALACCLSIVSYSHPMVLLMKTQKH